MSEHPCLLLHGFTGGPFEVQPLADYLQDRGKPCEVPGLPWGGNITDLQTTYWTDWVRASENVAQQMANRYGCFDLIGFSMGGLLAAYLSVRYPVRRLVLLNTAIVYVSPARFIRVVTKEWKKDKELIPLSKVKTTPLRATWQFTRLVRHLKPELAHISAPTLIVQSQMDQVIHPLSAKIIYNKLCCERELKWFPQSRHLICLGDEAPLLFREVHEFLDHE